MINFILQYKSAMLYFERYNSLKANAQALYWQLYHLANLHNWQPFMTSRRELNARLNKNDETGSTVSDDLRKLKNAGLIDFKSYRRGTLITILNTYEDKPRNISKHKDKRRPIDNGGNNYEYAREGDGASVHAGYRNCDKVPQRERPIGN